jgi:hypothetical protein
VELVHVCHGDARKGIKVSFQDGVGGLDGALHAGCVGCALFGVGDDEDEGVDVGPVGFGGRLDSEGVCAIWEGANFPCDEATEEGAAGGAGALARDEGELGGCAGQVVEGC